MAGSRRLTARKLPQFLGGARKMAAKVVFADRFWVALGGSKFKPVALGGTSPQGFSIGSALTTSLRAVLARSRIHFR
jgi:hypothetical protein